MKRNCDAIIKKLKKDIKFLKKDKFYKRPLKEKKKINDKAFDIAFNEEFFRLITIFEYRTKILLGFHPDQVFKYKSFSGTEIKEKNNMEKYQYKYNFNFKTENIWFYFGCPLQEIDHINPQDKLFYATSNFYVGYEDDKKINIKIRNPCEVTSNIMRDNIEKIYTKFRNSIDIKRTEWGKISGKKELLKRRNEELRLRYANIRSEKSNLAADKALELTLEILNKNYASLSLSPERAKRILYDKKK